MELITNQKGGQSLLWDGCRFNLNRKLDNGTCYWRCHKRSYAARMTTLGTDTTANKWTHPCSQPCNHSSGGDKEQT